MNLANPNWRHWRCRLLLGVVLAGAGAGRAQVMVSSLGEAGWFADDSRNAQGVDLVGLAHTRLGKPGQTATATDDLALERRMYFTTNTASPNGSGALTFVMDSAPGKASKSTLALGGDFGGAEQLVAEDFRVRYGWMASTASSSTRLVFRIGLQTSLYGTGAGQTQAGFTATRTGESAWDVILVYVPPASSSGVWNSTTITAETTGWKVYFQSGNTFWSQHYGLTSAFGSVRSLEQWAAFDYDPNTSGVQSFLEGASIVSLQFGLGSSTSTGESSLASFETSLLGESYTFAAVPEPGAGAAAAGLAALLLVIRRRRR